MTRHTLARIMNAWPTPAGQLHGTTLDCRDGLHRACAHCDCTCHTGTSRTCTCIHDHEARIPDPHCPRHPEGTTTP